MNYKFFKEIQPERGIHGNFASGQINYKWKTSQNTAWVPAQSYLKIKMSLFSIADAGTPLLKSEDVAPNMMICDNLFQQINMRINGVKVSEMNDYVAQCAALKCRLNCDMNNRQSLLSDINYTKIDQVDRMSQITSDGLQEKKIVWRKGAMLAANAASGRTLDFLDLATPNRVEFAGAGADNEVRFTANGGRAIPDLEKYFSVGDYIYTNDGGERASLVTGFKSIVSQNDTLTIGTVNANVAAANLVAQVRIHDKYYIDRSYSSSVQNKQFELIWKPPLGFFDIASEVSGNYNLEITPQPNGVWQRYAIESVTENREVDVHYRIDITEMNLYAWTHVHPQPINDTQTFVYTDLRCGSQNLTTKSLTQHTFNVDPNNHSLTIAFQDSQAGDDTRLSRSKFKIVNDQELQIKKFYLNMDGITLPDPLPSPECNEITNVNELYQRYVENFHYSGAFNSRIQKYESMEEWKRAGIFFHYRWGTGYRKSGSVMVYTNFTQNADVDGVPKADWLGRLIDGRPQNPQLLLFDHYYTTLLMNVKDGQLISIQKM